MRCSCCGLLAQSKTRDEQRARWWRRRGAQYCTDQTQNPTTFYKHSSATPIKRLYDPGKDRPRLVRHNGVTP